MAGFLYFLPGARSIEPKQLAELGLSYALDPQGSKSVLQVHKGPEGLNGLLFANAQRVDPGRCGYYPERQTWRKHHAKGFYVGMETGLPIGPEDLLRKDALPGVDLQLGDDRYWRIPRARRWSGDDDPEVAPLFEICLEQRMEQDATGEMVPGTVLPRYAELWGIATAYFHHCVGAASDEEEDVLRGGDDTLTLTRACVLTARVLQANYAVGLLECSLLGLLTSSNWRAILDALIDWDTYDALRQKKTARRLALLSSSSGPEDSSQNIGPPSPTS